MGLWVAPGGKIEYFESPQEGAVRELREETGLDAHQLALRGIVSLVLPTVQQPCLHFLYQVLSFTGELREEEREGRLKWWPLELLPQVPMPAANQLFLPHILAQPECLYQAKYVLDATFQVVEVVEY